MSEYARGIVVIVIALFGLGFGVKTLHGKKQALAKQVDRIQAEITTSDEITQKLTQNVNKRMESMKRVEDFYRAWLPHVHRCQNTSELLSNLLRIANRHDLIPFEKETTENEHYQFRGEDRDVDVLQLTLGGRYEDLIRFLDDVRLAYPFVGMQSLSFAVTKSSVTLSVHFNILRMELPEEDIASLSPASL